MNDKWKALWDLSKDFAAISGCLCIAETESLRDIKVTKPVWV